MGTHERTIRVGVRYTFGPGRWDVLDGFQNAKHEQPSAPQKLLRSPAGAVPVHALP